MAILRGFPASSTISPSIRITEKDLSFIAPNQSFHRAGLVGFASKGPINVPTLISTNRALHTTFGNPHYETGDPYLIYAAEQYLLVANELMVVRVADVNPTSDEQATTASVSIPAAGAKVVIQSVTAEPYIFSEEQFFKWRLNGVLAGKSLSLATGTYTAAQAVAGLNAQLNTEDGIEFVANGNDIAVQTTFAYGPLASLELVSVQDSMYTTLGIGTSMTAGAITGELDRYPNDDYQTQDSWNLSGLTGLNLIVVVDGTDNSAIDNVAQVIDLENLEGGTIHIQDVVDEINDQITAGTIPGGFIASKSTNNLTITTLAKGRDSKILLKSDSTAAGIFGFAGDTYTSGVLTDPRNNEDVGESPSGVTGTGSEAFGIVTGEADDATVTFTLTADSSGIEGNATQVKIANSSAEGTFSMEVYSGGVQVESWGGLTKDETSRYYVETFLASVSSFVRASDVTSSGAPPKNGTYALSGGSDGIPADADDQDALLIGSDVGMSGMFALSEPEQYDIDLIAVPGHSSTVVTTALLSLAEQRGDCLALIDPPFGLTVTEIVQWQNGVHALNDTRFDSDFGALFWPWVLIRDNYAAQDVWVPPSGAAMATIARSDGISAPWFAAAGASRGRVPSILDVYSRPTLAERDEMYGNRNAVNPIITFGSDSGFVIWGNKTLQRRPTALDRINVRRLMFTIEKRIRAQSRGILFDPHDTIIRERFINIANDVLSEIQIGRGLIAYIVQCDEELNPPDVVDRNELRARIGVQPTRSAEFIFIEFSVHRTGTFTETSDSF